MAYEKIHMDLWMKLNEFIETIEGFDYDRAAHCTTQLIEAHYDTIDVLKLATKSELVEDTGLKPGDALRIVSAAKSIRIPRKRDESQEVLPAKKMRIASKTETTTANAKSKPAGARPVGKKSSTKIDPSEFDSDESEASSSSSMSDSNHSESESDPMWWKY